ncbi:MAG: HAMP domain-containing protein, partial [Elusimicrobia bacterium]|nr:HAMP domain-containing protein [Elusimicrobiota bacterium]
MVLNSHSIKRNNIEIFTRELTATAKIISAHITYLLKTAPHNQVDAFVKNSTADSNMRITVIMQGGQVIADSAVDITNFGFDSHIARAEIEEAFADNLYTVVRHSNTLNKELLYVALPLHNNEGDVFAVLRLAMPLQSITYLSYDFILKNYGAFIVVGIAAFLLSFLISRHFGKKIEELNQAFGELSKGNFNIRLDIQTNDEFQKLSTTFNEMSEQMRKTFQETNASKDELNKIINSVSDGIMVTGSDGKILLANPGFKKFFPYNQALNPFYWQVVTGKQFSVHMSAAGAAGAQFVLEHLQKHYLCTIAPVQLSNSFVSVFHDISGMKNLENFKKDLISNVSHELKTPLSSIKAYAEFLETETDPEQIKNFSAVISRNTARLSNIVNDLLTLSELEHSETLNIETFKLTEVFNEIAGTFTSKAKAKNINLVLNCCDKIEIKADKFRLSQALLNTIDNALRYTEAGTVTANTDKTGSGLTITVRDTGIGIQDQH